MMEGGNSGRIQGRLPLPFVPDIPVIYRVKSRLKFLFSHDKNK